MDFSAANAYITSPNVTTLNITSDNVHDNLWHLFQELLVTNYETIIQTSEWTYAGPFRSAVSSIKRNTPLQSVIY